MTKLIQKWEHVGVTTCARLRKPGGFSPVRSVPAEVPVCRRTGVIESSLEGVMSFFSQKPNLVESGQEKGPWKK